MPWINRLSVTFERGEYAARTNDWLEYRENGKRHKVPPGFYTDFGSVPGYVVLPCLVPRIGRTREAFVLHDWHYRTAVKPRRIVDRLLFTSALELLDAATDIAQGERALYKARMALAYVGVRMWGWIPWMRYRRNG